jgi:hypothetical protein
MQQNTLIDTHGIVMTVTACHKLSADNDRAAFSNDRQLIKPPIRPPCQPMPKAKHRIAQETGGIGQSQNPLFLFLG